MQTQAISLASNATGAADGSEVQWTGGRGCLVIQATTYPTVCKLQLAAQNGVFVNVDPSDFSANGVYAYDLPAGTYKLSMSGGTVAGVYAKLVSIPFG